MGCYTVGAMDSTTKKGSGVMGATSSDDMYDLVIDGVVVETLTEEGPIVTPAKIDHRTAGQIDRESRGMVLFNNQEITREAYDRIRSTTGIDVSANDILGTAGVAASGVKHHVERARNMGNGDMRMQELDAAVADAVQALTELLYVRGWGNLPFSGTTRDFNSADVETACAIISERILTAL